MRYDVIQSIRRGHGMGELAFEMSQAVTGVTITSFYEYLVFGVMLFHTGL